MADEDTPAGGRLLGTSKLQTAVDALANVVQGITQTLQGARAGLGQAAGGPGGGSNGGSWNRGSNWNMGAGGNGGGAAFSGTPAAAARYRGGPAPTQASPDSTNGDAGASRSSRIGAAVGGAAVGGAVALAAHGSDKLSDMVTMQTAAYLATQGNNSMGWRNASHLAFQNNFGAQSTADAASAFLTTARTTGYQAGTAQFGAQWNYAKSASLVNPNVTQTQAAQASGSLWAGSSYNSLRSYGIQTIKGGVGQSPRQIAQQILQKIPGTNQIKNGDQLTAALDSPAGGINQTLQAWSAQGMLGGQSVDVIREEIRGILLAQIKGTSFDQYSQMMTQAAGGNKAAKANLGKLGIGGSSAQTLMTREGHLRNRDDSELGGFTTGLEQSTAVLNKFTDAMTGLLNKTGLGAASGYGGAFSSFIGGTAVGSKLMGFMGPALKGIMGAAGDGIGGGAAGDSGGGGSGSGAKGSVATGTSGAGKTGSAVISIARRYLGMPYHWGGKSPQTSFDCSGLVQYAFGQIGVKLPRVAKDQQNVGTAVSLTAVQPGDLIFMGKPAHHVAIYMGGGKLIEAPHTGANIRIRTFNPGEWTGGARRILGSVGNMNDINSAGGMGAGGDSTRLSQGVGGGDMGSYGSELDALSGLLGGLAGSGGGRGTTGQPGGSTTTTSAPTGTAGAGNGLSGNMALGQKLAGQRGWGSGAEWNSLNTMWTKESGWNNNAQNPSSTAYGIPQLLDGTWGGTGVKKSSNPSQQIQAGLNYIQKRYGDPNKAWSFWQKHHWYDKGAIELKQDETIRAHKGEMIVPADQASSFRSAIAGLTSGFGGGRGGGGGPVITFAPGSIVFQGVVGNASDAAAFAKTIVDAVAEDDRLAQIAGG